MRLSVIIPTYNRAEMVGQAIASTLDAAVEGMEIIVVDDGSTDDTRQVLAGFGAAIRVIRQANAGPARARNVGVAGARGTFVKFVDSDDLVPPAALRALLEAATAARADEIVLGDVECLFPDGSIAPGSVGGYGYRSLDRIGPLTLVELLTGGMSTEIPLFPRTALEQVGGFDEAIRMGEDWELMLRLVRHGWSFSRIAAIAAVVRMHGAGRLTDGGNAARFDDALRCFEAMRSSLIGSPQASRAAHVALARQIWVVARDAARSGHLDQAETLFELARSEGGRDAELGHPLVRALYRLVTPVCAERLSERVKRVVGRL